MKWKFRCEGVVAVVRSFEALNQTLCHRQSKVQLCDLGLCSILVKNVAVHKSHINEVKEDPLPPLDRTVGKSVIEK